MVVEFLDSIKDMRHTHQMAIVPLAVEMCFVASRYDVLARDMAGSRFVVDRKAAFEADRAHMRGWGPLGVFGSRRVITKPPPA